jgi:glycosyltransferase involved in cell wall biosynthesis
MLDLLLVSIAFPPKKDPECIQTARYFKYLCRNDLNIDILTSSSPTLFMPIDESLVEYDTGWRSKTELPIQENKYLNFIRRKAGLSTGLPDTKSSFHQGFKKARKKLKYEPDVIYSRSYPLSSSIMAFKMAEFYQVPWILHLSDPWADSPLHLYTHKESRYHQEWEKNCFTRANAICLTSQKSIDFYSEKYPSLKDRFHFFPNVYDPHNIKKNPIVGDKFRIVYAGGLAGTRSPETFLEALSLFNQTNPDHPELEVIFAGPMDRRMTDIVQSYNLVNFKHIGPLSLDKSLDLQKSAHALLLIDSPMDDPKLSMFFPSKILEYFVAQRKIFAVTTKSSSSEEILNSLGFDCFDFNEEEKLAEYLRIMLDDYKTEKYSSFILDHIPSEYSAAIQAERLYQLIKEI